MLLLVLMVTGLSYTTAEKLPFPQQVNISSCPWNVFGVYYETLYFSFNASSNKTSMCTLGYFDPDVQNICLHVTTATDVDTVEMENYTSSSTDSFTAPSGVTVTGSYSCYLSIYYYKNTTNKVSFYLESYDPPFGMVYITQDEPALFKMQIGDISYYEKSTNGDSLVILGCTVGSTFVNSNWTSCTGPTLKTCSANSTEIIDTKCAWGCWNEGCVDTCSVLGSNVIDVNGVKGAISDLCGYTLLSGGPVQLGAVFKERRHTDVPLLDHLELSVGSTKIHLGPGAAQVQVNGSLVNISTALMPQGVNVSKTSSGISLQYQQMFELVFDGSSAVLDITDPTGLTGLCISAANVSAAVSAALSSAGCDTVQQEPPDVSVNCSIAKQQCELLNSSLFSDCHSTIDPSLFMETCEEFLCKYPSKDGFDCAFHDAYAAVCSMFNVTLPEWKTSANCKFPVDFCKDTYCSDHEFCGAHMYEETCICRALFAAKYNGTLGDPTVCSQNSASLSLAACLLTAQGVHYDELQLVNPNCTGVLDATSHMLNFGFDADNMCGTNVTSENNQLIFKNKVVLKNHTSSIITRHNQFELDFSCYYDQPEIKTMALKIKDSSVVQTIVSGLWSYNLTMKAYLDSDLIDPIVPTTELQLDQPIWVELSAEELDQDLVSIVTDSCWGTSQQPSNSTPQYKLIQNGCANPADASVKVTGNGVGTSNSFTFKMFEFTGLSSDVYLHCEVSLCVTSDGCAPVCGGGLRRRRRSLKKHRNRALITMSWTN
ncbi:hypothetical protein NL108_017645 [Boleophthalmus pectinirostris]|uniref:uncharacterized protein LOC129409182 n=1 Tax=Boleophthalmus pectinirostris TaxID=150288 RepID=UPI00242EF03A|nr:uncharacterized protein LOC129409182 [Boleophthalmus pectinirostris]KAJ0056788.1 hypothetical protein NL108_017645 [Boleophthalmus pectinirostris]